MIEAGMFQAVELPLVLLGGLLGSSHCIGMCGGFAVAIGYGADRVLSNVARQVTWSSGRVFTYTFGGAVAGFAGAQAGNRFSFTSMQGVLALLAGVLLIVQGLLSAGVLPRRRKVPGKCSAVSQLAWLLPIGRSDRNGNVAGAAADTNARFSACCVVRVRHRPADGQSWCGRLRTAGSSSIRHRVPVV